MECMQCRANLAEPSAYCPQCGQAVAADASLREVVSAGGPTQTVALPVPAATLAENNHSAALSPVTTAPETAETALELAPLDPEAVHALLTQANLQRVRGQWEAAIDFCVDALRAQPGSQTAHALLGDIYRDQGKTSDAIQWYRMALDLRPNPADEAKLRRLEREYARTEATALRRARGGYDTPGALAPIAEDAPPTGTAVLVGLSPRRWLRALTATALAFAALTVVALIAMRPGRHVGPILARPLTQFPGGSSVSTGLLPPARLGGGVILPSGETPAPNASAPSAAGSGLAPDRVPSAPVLRETAPPREAPSARVPATPGLAPAPITSVRPLPNGLANQSSGLSLPRAEAQERLPGFSGAASARSLELTGGVQRVRLQTDPGAQNAASLLLTAPYGVASLGNADTRALLMSNLIRAAQKAFADSPALAHVSVTIQPAGTDAPIDGLLSARIDRETAQSLNPDGESLDRLQSRLTDVQWGGVMAPHAAPDSVAPLGGVDTQQ